MESVTLDVSLPFVKGFSLLQSTGFILDVSLPFIKGFSVLQSTGCTLDVSLPFVMKHDLKANIGEKISNIPAETLVRVMENTRNRFIHLGSATSENEKFQKFQTARIKTLSNAQDGREEGRRGGWGLVTDQNASKSAEG